jgi:hypothetical protein
MEEVKFLEEAKAESSRIGRVIDALNAREKAYNEKLAKLRGDLPNMLAKMALEEGITRAEVDDMEESAKLLEERISEIPITLKGLEPRRLSAQYQVGNVIRQIEKLYKSTKDKLKDGDESSTLIEQLKTCAPHIGMVEDCEEFLRKLEKAKTD